MAENKKSVVIYTDWIHIFEELKDAEAGRLIKHFLRYVNDRNPEPPDRLTKIAFEPIKQQLKRDLAKWEVKKGYWSDAGKASAEARRLKKENSTESTDVKNVKENSTESTVTVNDTVNVNAIVTVNVKNKEDVSLRKTTFKDSLTPFLEKYGREMLNDFFSHWTEMNEGGKKMRFEMQKVFEIRKRLATWRKNEIKFSKKSSSGGLKFPDYYDISFESKLNTIDMQAYWKHLRSLGLSPKKRENSNETIDWIKK